MHPKLVATLLVLPATVGALAPAARSACDATTVLFAHPDTGVWIEEECHPYSAHDGTEDEATASVGFDRRAEPYACTWAPPVVALGRPVPGTGQAYCAPREPAVGGASLTIGPLPDTGVVTCRGDACVWVTPGDLAYRCALVENAPLVVIVPGTNTVLTVTCAAT